MTETTADEIHPNLADTSEQEASPGVRAFLPKVSKQIPTEL